MKRAGFLWGTVRARTTAAAAIVFGIALIVAAVAMVILLRRSLTNDVRASALLRAETVADGVRAGRPSSGIPAGDEEFVQVVDSDGAVIAASEHLAGLAPIADLRPGESQRIGVTFEDDPFLAVALEAKASNQTYTVLAGRTLETVDESSAAVVGLLAAGVPLLILVVAGVTWRVVGRALEPVESMRAEVEAISTTELHRRVPDPPGSDEITRLAATMNRMLARLEDGQIRQRRFVSDASHELRSPVATIRQHAEVARSHPEGTTTEELADVVLEENIRLQQLVDDLLLLSKLDEGTLQMNVETVDLDDVLFEEADRLRATTELRVDTRGVSAGRVTGDRSQLQKLVRNIVDNAARHATGRVSMTLSESDGRVVMTVDDDGRGIPPVERDRIFERFVRLDESRDRDSGGSGLGLAIVSEIATAHRADVVVADGAAGGARFEVRFPAGS